MESFWHWLTELAEVYARHAARHGPNRLLPAEVLPGHGRVPGHGGLSPQGAGPDESAAEHSAPGVHMTRINAMEDPAMAHEARHGSGDNGHGAQARLQHTPGPSDPGTPRHQIQHTIDLPHQELGLKRALEPP